MSKQPKQPRTNIGPALHSSLKRSADAQLRAQVLEIAQDIFDRYVWGESFKDIAASLPFKIPGWRLRHILLESDETREMYTNAAVLRSHNLIEEALDYGRQAAAIGDSSGLKVAIDTNIKVAAKLNPAYNDKATIEHTGQGGGPIKLLALTDEQLLAIAAKGAQEDQE